MAYAQKYFYTFGSINNDKNYKVEIYEDGFTGTTEEIQADQIGFVLTHPEINNKFQSVRGSGFDISLLSEDSMKFINLYTYDIFELKVKLYENTNLIFSGYLNSELYSEPFSEKNNYTVNLNGNDGLALLERLDYLTIEGAKYTGIETNFDIIKRVLLKLNIDWNNIYIGLSTTSPEISIGATESILNGTYSFNENYYDEDGISKNCRDVLTTILSTFSAYIQIINNDLYITDVNKIATGSSSFLKYDSNFNYISTVSIDTDLGDLSTIGFSSNVQKLDVISPINKQKISVSNYIQEYILNYIPSEDKYSGLTETTSYGTGGNTWYEEKYTISEKWLGYPLLGSSRFVKMFGTNNNLNETDIYLKHEGNNLFESEDSIRFIYTGDIPTILPSSEYFLKIEAKAYLVGTLNLGEDPTFNTPRTLYLRTELESGTKKYTTNTKSWVSTGTTNAHFNWSFTNVTKDENGAIVRNEIAEKWIDLTEASSPEPLIVPLDGFDDPNFTFNIKGYKIYDDDFNDVGQGYGVKLKDIKFTVVDSSYNEVSDDDTEYIAYINKYIKDDGQPIQLHLGTNVDKVPVAFGNILAYDTDYYYPNDFTRNGKTDILENLLMRSIISNYTPKNIFINCDINIINSLFGTITINNHLPGSLFMITGSKIDYENSTINVSLQEIFEDSGNITKNY